MMNQSGTVQNTYKYDPFGKVIQQSEQIINFFMYIGQLGVISDGELQDIYMMRDRHYDAQHGRFISLDPIGIHNYIGPSITVLTSYLKILFCRNSW